MLFSTFVSVVGLWIRCELLNKSSMRLFYLSRVCPNMGQIVTSRAAPQSFGLRVREDACLGPECLGLRVRDDGCPLERRNIGIGQLVYRLLLDFKLR